MAQYVSKKGAVPRGWQLCYVSTSVWVSSSSLQELKQPETSELFSGSWGTDGSICKEPLPLVRHQFPERTPLPQTQAPTPLDSSLAHISPPTHDAQNHINDDDNAESPRDRSYSAPVYRPLAASVSTESPPDPFKSEKRSSKATHGDEIETHVATGTQKGQKKASAPDSPASVRSAARRHASDTAVAVAEEEEGAGGGGDEGTMDAAQLRNVSETDPEGRQSNCLNISCSTMQHHSLLHVRLYFCWTRFTLCIVSFIHSVLFCLFRFPRSRQIDNLYENSYVTCMRVACRACWMRNLWRGYCSLCCLPLDATHHKCWSTSSSNLTASPRSLCYSGSTSSLALSTAALVVCSPLLLS